MEINSILSAWKNQWDSLSYDHMKQFLRNCLQQTKQTVQYMWNNNRGLFVGLLIPVALWAGVFCSPSNSLMFPLFGIATIISILPSIIIFLYIPYLYSITLRHLHTHNPNTKPYYDKYLVLTYFLLSWTSFLIMGALSYVGTHVLFIGIVLIGLYFFWKNIRKDSPADIPLVIMAFIATPIIFFALTLLGVSTITFSSMIFYPFTCIATSIPFFYFIEAQGSDWIKKFLYSLTECLKFSCYFLPTIFAYGVIINIFMLIIMLLAIPVILLGFFALGALDAFVLLFPTLTPTAPLFIIPAAALFIGFLYTITAVKITIGYNLYQQYKTLPKGTLTQEPHDLS